MLQHIRALTFLFVVVAVTIAVDAQQPIHPNTDRGFKPEGVYQLGDLDNVNLFNGQLNLTIPMGPSFPMGGGNSYSLTLTYSSRAWDFRSAGNCAIYPDPVQYVVQSFPAMHSNAGLGWLLSLGRLILRDSPEYPYDNSDPEFTLPDGPLEIYEGPDGSRHAFYGRMHPGNDLYVQNSASDPVMGTIKSIAYTKDGTYMRRKLYASGLVDIETPDGLTRRFNVAGELIRIFDTFGNFVNVTTTHVDLQDPGSAIQRVEIVDQYLRKTTIQYKDWTSDFKNYKRLVDYVEFPAFDGTPAKYTFGYTDLLVRRADTPSLQYCESNITVPFLTSISLPVTASGQESFTFDYGLGMTYGAVSRMGLPTGGAISWTYDYYRLPAVACAEAAWFDTQIGVKERSLIDRDGTTVIGTWHYDSEMGGVFPPTDAWNAGMICDASEREWDTGTDPHPYGQQLAEYVTTTVVAPNQEHGAVSSQTGTKTLHYFSAWSGDPYNGGTDHPASGATWGEYGLPFARGVDGLTAPPFLSTRTYATENSTTKVRSTFVQYTREPVDVFQGSDQSDGHRRMILQRTVFDDDGGRQVTQEQSDFDGFGHYRTVTSTGTLSGDTVTRYTSYNEISPVWRTDATGEVLGAFAFEPLYRWLPNLFTEQTVQAAASGVNDVNRTLYCFDRTTGYLAGKRTLAQHTSNPSPASTDTLALFFHDGFGNTTEERYYGGDGNGTNYAGCDPGSMPIGYRVFNTYSNGVLATSRYDGTSFLSVDNTIHGSTGLVWKTRDTDGVETTFEYDDRTRLTRVSPTGQGVNRYTYRANTTFDPAAVIVEQRNAAGTTTLDAQRYEYDGLGRLTTALTTTGLTQLPALNDPASAWVQSRTVYNALGAKTRVYEPYTGSTPGAFAEFRGFDPFGRVGTIETPDSSETRFSYLGQRVTERTVTVQTQSGPTESKTTEVYDNHGRLSSVIEPAGTGGADATTEYSYDAGGRLTKVCQNKTTGCGQTRTFVYDGRGFLNQETHPEAGSTFYGGYDARGNATTRTKSTTSLFDQAFTYDSAGRLTQVSTRDPNATTSLTRPLKLLTFAGANAGSNLQKGKLASATRYNYIPATGGGEELITVREDHTYGDAAGRPTERLTTIRNESTSQLLQILRQSVAYDDLGNVLTENYPNCEGVGCTGGTNKFNSVSRAYTLGRLLSVSSSAAQTLPVASAIRYLPNGMIGSVTHGNGVVETVALDTSGMARPGSITFTGFNESSSCAAPSITGHPASTTVQPGGTALLSVAASGSNLSYQWYQVTGSGSVEISGAIYSSYTTPALNETTSYWVRVTSTCGSEASSTNSNVATVTVSGGGGAQAPARVQMASSSGYGPSVSSTWPASTTNGNLLVAILGQRDCAEPGEVQFAAPTGWTLAVNRFFEYEKVAIYYIENAAPRSGTETFTLLAGRTELFSVTLLEYANIASAGALDQTASATPAPGGTGSLVSSGTTATTTTGNELLLTAIVMPSAGVVTFSNPTNLFTEIAELPLASGICSGGSVIHERIVSAQGAYGHQATASQSQRWAGAIATFRGTGSCGDPSISTQPQSQTIASGQSATLSVSAGGDNTYQWVRVTAPSGAITGATSSTYNTGPLTSSTTYYVKVTNSCGSVDSNQATVTIGTSPTSLVATATSPTGVALTWGAISEVDSYEIERRSGGSAFALRGTSTTNSFTDTATAGQAYAYRVRAKYVGGGSSDYTNVDIATTFTFAEALVSGATIIKASHVAELRQAVDALRVTAALSGYAWTDNPITSGMLIRAQHLQELRAALNGARTSLDVPALGFTDASIVVGVTPVKAIHWLELREGVK